MLQQEEFEELVLDAVAELPEELLSHLDNVAIRGGAVAQRGADG